MAVLSRPTVVPTLLLRACLVALVLVPAGPGTARAEHGAGRVLGRPVPGEVVQPFDAPTRYGPGHRGVDLAATPGTPVVAVGAGRVTFAGTVVGNRWVTVDHGGLRTTVGPLGAVRVVRGQLVARGTILGTSALAHGRPAVHLSARVGERYVDPLRVRGPVVSLVPPATRPSAGGAVGARAPWHEPAPATTGRSGARSGHRRGTGLRPDPAGAWRARVR